MKTAKDYLEQANAVVPKITAEEGMAKHSAGETLFIDVHDSGDIAKSGTIAGAARIPRAGCSRHDQFTWPQGSGAGLLRCADKRRWTKVRVQ